MEMQWWNWATLAAGLVAAFGVILNEIRRFQNRRRIEWSVGYITHPALSVFIRNAGDTDANKIGVLFFNCEPKGPSGPRSIELLKSNEAHEIDMEVVDDDAWLIDLLCPSRELKQVFGNLDAR